MNFLHRNLFAKLRAENFSTGEQMEPMTHFKHEKINRMMDNIQNMPPGSVEFNNYFLNHRHLRGDAIPATPHCGQYQRHAFLWHFLERYRAIRQLPQDKRGQSRLRETGELVAQAPHPPYGTVARQHSHAFLQFRTG